LEATDSGSWMKIRLIVKFENLWLALLDVVHMHIENVREPRPQNIDGYFIEHVVKNIDTVNLLHLFSALLIDLDHNQTRVNIEQLPVAIFFEFIKVIFGDDLTEDLVKHKCLLSLVTYLKIKEVQNKCEFLGDCIRD
jgi:hypothetical protein